MTRDFRLYQEHPHFDLRPGCGCNPCGPSPCLPNFPIMPDFCNRPSCPPSCPPTCPPQLKRRGCNEDLMWLLVGIGIGQILDK